MMDFTGFAALEMYHAVLAEQRQDRQERKWPRLWRDLRRGEGVSAITPTTPPPTAGPPNSVAGARHGC